MGQQQERRQGAGEFLSDAVAGGAQCTTPAYVNHVRTTRGRVVALCQHCGKRSRSSRPDDDGEPSLWEVGRGWSQAPYPPAFKHDDGSVGSTWTCPTCNGKLQAGQALRVRQYSPR